MSNINNHRKKRLLIFDMDGVIYSGKSFWMDLHKAYGTFEIGKRYTDKYLYENYSKLIDLVVGDLWKGRSARIYLDLIAKRHYEPGVVSTIKSLPDSFVTAIISSGPGDLARRAKEELKIEHVISNEVVIEDGVLTGKFIANVPNEKADVGRKLAEKLGFKLSETMFVAEDKNDVDLARIVGLSVAYNSKSKSLNELSHYHLKRGEFPKILKIINDWHI